MVFSFPVYLDPPNNWHQQPNHHQLQANDSESPQPQLVPPPLPPYVASGAGSIIRPGTTEDRVAQLAKVPPAAPEAALKCPRCESTNTKFCYFNNYSLSQPRHFCKTCRRYWTRGGALRNVPVGGGCRRNRKNKKSPRSKSPFSTEKQTLFDNSTASAMIPSPSSSLGVAPHHLELIGQFPQPTTNRPFMASLQNLRGHGVGNMGLSLREHMGFQFGGNNNSSASAAAGGGGEVDQWRLQQYFPFSNGFESAPSAVNSYPYQSERVETPSGLVGIGVGGGGDIAASSRVTQLQLPPVKLEEHGGLNLIRSPLTVSGNNNQYYSWTDLSGLASSSSTSHLL